MLFNSQTNKYDINSKGFENINVVDRKKKKTKLQKTKGNADKLIETDERFGYSIHESRYKTIKFKKESEYLYHAKLERKIVSKARKRRSHLRYSKKSRINNQLKRIPLQEDGKVTMVEQNSSNREEKEEEEYNDTEEHQLR